MCEKYDVVTDQWTTVSFGLPVSCQTSLLHDNNIQILNTRTWSWSYKSMINNAAQFFTCAVMKLPNHVLQ